MALAVCGSTADPHGRELISHGTALFPAACYRDDFFLEDVPCPWHWHDELEAVTVAQGEVLVAAGGQRFTVPAGGGFFINARVLHNVWDHSGRGFRLHSVVFHPRLVGGSLDSVFWQDYLLPLMSPQAPGYVRLNPAVPWNQAALAAVEEAWHSAAREEPGFQFRIRTALSDLVFQLVSYLPAEPRTPSDKALRDESRVKDMMRFVQANYAQELTTAQIAASAAISESECLRCFRATIGTTPIQYLRQFRVQKAAELLTDTTLKIGEIGVRCGFQEMSYFARTFRELKGCTPSLYRAQKQEKL